MKSLHRHFNLQKTVIAGLLLVLAVALAAILISPSDTPRPPVVPSSQPTAPSRSAQLTPVELRIPSLAVASPLIQLGIQPSGELEVPQDYSQVGWYKYGAVPGNPGPAVFAGHLDSPTGPAVFYRLRELQVGQPIEVALSDGSTIRFTVTRTTRFPRNQFPTNEVYGRTEHSEIRLITCDGLFNDQDRRYSDNLIIFGITE